RGFRALPATPRRGGKRYRQPYRALWSAAACLACCCFDADGNVPSPLKRKQACALQRRATKSCKENTNSQRSITNRSSFVLARRMRALPGEHGWDGHATKPLWHAVAGQRCFRAGERQSDLPKVLTRLSGRQIGGI